MKSHHDQFLHEIDAEEILSILNEGCWQAYNNDVNSASTNTNDAVILDDIETIENTSGIDAYRDIAFEAHVRKVLDVGGGKYDCNRDYLRNKKNIDLLIWDPFNRSRSHNEAVKAEVQASSVDAAVSMSVLNVVPDIQSRLAHIATLFAALSPGGKAYFKVWPGEDLFRGSYLPIATESYYQANAFADRFYREIEVVFGSRNVKLDKRIPNLIVATKNELAPFDLLQIKAVQFKVSNEMPLLFKLRQRSTNKLFQFHQNLLIRNLCFFKSAEKQHLVENRHHSACAQEAYDRRFGVAIKS